MDAVTASLCVNLRAVKRCVACHRTLSAQVEQMSTPEYKLSQVLVGHSEDVRSSTAAHSVSKLAYYFADLNLHLRGFTICEQLLSFWQRICRSE
jgi:hypothetical protein